jgi:hypothetical protein
MIQNHKDKFIENKKHDATTLSHIQQGLDEKFFLKIAATTKSKDVCNGDDIYTELQALAILNEVIVAIEEVEKFDIAGIIEETMEEPEGKGDYVPDAKHEHVKKSEAHCVVTHVDND